MSLQDEVSYVHPQRAGDKYTYACQPGKGWRCRGLLVATPNHPYPPDDHYVTDDALVGMI